MEDKRDTTSEQHESVKPTQAQDGLPMPIQLAALPDAEYKALGRRATLKMDLVIMPILVTMYILNYLDRQNIASAKLANIEQDLDLSPVEYQTAVSILFCSYSKFSTNTSPCSALTQPRSPLPGPIQHDRRPHQMAWHLHLLQHGYLGRHLGHHGICA